MIHSAEGQQVQTQNQSHKDPSLETRRMWFMETDSNHRRTETLGTTCVQVLWAELGLLSAPPTSLFGPESCALDQMSDPQTWWLLFALIQKLWF